MIGNTLVSQPMALPTEAIRVLEPHGVTENAKTLGNSRVFALQLGDGGFDSPHDSAGNVRVDEKSGAHSGARGDSRLVKLIEVWPALSDDLKGEILTLVGLRPYDFDDVAAEADQV